MEFKNVYLEDSTVFREEAHTLSEKKRIVEEEIVIRSSERISEIGKADSRDGYIAVLGNKKKNNEIDADVKSYREFLETLYFGHVELSSKEGIDSLYITEGDHIRVGDTDIVYSWKSPLCKTYYENRTKFNVNGFDYKLMLKRGLIIETGQLSEVHELYKKTDVVGDPFLNRVLRARKSKNELTDIIKSIQAKQYKIISYPLKENFVVQGCAGSGKTVILLHRLSYLLFQAENSNLDVNKIAVLTPNKDFNLYINDLSEKLGLQKIAKMTVEQFYQEILDRYEEAAYEDEKRQIILRLEKDWIDSFKARHGHTPSANESEFRNSRGELAWKPSYEKHITIRKNNWALKKVVPERSDRKDILTRAYSTKLIEECKKAFTLSREMHNVFSADKLYWDSFMWEAQQMGIQLALYPDKTVDRYELVLRLHFYTLLYDDRIKFDYSFINIDEAQDLSKSEFELLSKLSETMNIYGDTKQKSFEWRGIKNWSDVCKFTKFNLAENYRNSQKITEFCNNEFRLNMTALGLPGKRVQFDSLEGALAQVKKHFNSSDKQRWGIIVPHFNGAIQKKFEEIGILRSPSSKNVVLHTPTSVKGLEFVRVYVVDSDLTESERYISFTRALEELHIIA